MNPKESGRFVHKEFFFSLYATDTASFAVFPIFPNQFFYQQLLHKNCFKN